MISSNDFKTGLTIIVDNNLMQIIEFLHVKPGKGAAFVRSKLKNVETGQVIEKTFRAGEKMETAHLERREMQFLFNDGDEYTFMDTETFDQIPVGTDVIGDKAPYLTENMAVQLQMFEGRPISIEIPQRATFEVVDTEPVMKGQTASGSFKPAMLSNGVRTMVPTHITVGVRIVVQTEDGAYVERAKD